MENEIYSIEENGFTKVKYYDADLDYTYYDALMNGLKVEIRTSKDKIEWRYLGVSMEEVEWFALKPIEKQPVEEIEVQEKEEIPISTVIQKNSFKMKQKIDILVRIHQDDKNGQLALNLTE